MARRKKRATSRKYRAAPRAFFKAKKRRSSKGTSSGSTAMQLIAAGLYGAGRGWLANFIAPVTARIPFGGIADEVGMLGANWAIGKFIGGKVPLLRQATKAGMLIESAAIGQAIVSGGLSMGGGSSSSVPSFR